jgi:ABC-2 type transport system ATP-binding protein
LPVLEARDLVKEYGSRRVVDEVGLTVSAGEIVVLVGPNGSGKTTTMEMLVGLRRPTAGSVQIAGQTVIPGGPHRLLVGVQLQEAGLPNRLRVQEALAATASLYAEPVDTAALLEALGLSGHARAMVDKLSGGQQRRLNVALACVGRPPLLVLDEPTSGLDPEGRAELWHFLRNLSQAGHAILTSTHDLSEAEAFADRVVMLRAGEVVATGPVPELLLQAGGDWRLRVTGTSRRLDALVRDTGHRSVSVGETTVVIGLRHDIEALRRALEESADHGDARTDVLCGPVRLEDLFLFARAPQEVR